MLKSSSRLLPATQSSIRKHEKTQILETTNLRILGNSVAKVIQEFSKNPQEILQKGKQKILLFSRKICKNLKNRRKFAKTASKKVTFLLSAGFFLLICPHVPFRNADGSRLPSSRFQTPAWVSPAEASEHKLSFIAESIFDEYEIK